MARTLPLLACGRWSRLGLPVLLLYGAGCMQQMASQPAYRPLEPSAFFSDGRSARPLVPGTIHRDQQFTSGRKPAAAAELQRVGGVVANLPGNPVAAVGAAAGVADYLDAFPKPLTAKLLDRGRDRFDIFCSMCHDRVGNGKGMIVQRGFTAPPSFHSDWSRGFKLKGMDVKLTDAPVGYFYEVITSGFGAMPEYAEQVPPDDRWAVIAYIRALQLSQRATIDDVSDPKEKQRLLQLRGR